MYLNKSFLAIIPARAGSKRLKNKNILDLAGKPLISWTIDAAKRSEYIDETIVSSDSEEILKIAKQSKIGINKRPSKLAEDVSSTIDVVQHVLHNHAVQHDYIILLQATSPLRTHEHIDSAIELIFKNRAKAIISVTEAEHSPLWFNTLPDNGSMANFINEKIQNKRSQDLKKYYRLNGAIYICKREDILKANTFFLNKAVYAYKMKNEDSIDIDTAYDFNIANYLLRRRLNSE